MKKLQIIQFFGDTDKILSKKCEPVTELTVETKQLIEDMIYTCQCVNGLGLAAPQVGKSLQIIVLKGKAFSNREEDWIYFINPEFDLLSGEKITADEYCLSFPRMGKKVERFDEVQISGFIKDLEQKGALYATGLGARIIQHEMDHLSGITLANK